MEEELLDDFRGGDETKERVNCSFKRIVSIILLILILALLIVLVGLNAQQTHDTMNISSGSSATTTVQSSLSTQIAEFIWKKGGQECNNGFTTDQVAVCLDKCNQEFGLGRWADSDQAGNSCGEFRNPVDYESCKNGCFCCEEYNACLIVSQDNEKVCQAALPQCNFSPHTFPPENDFARICYITQTVGDDVCSFINIGFEPVPCVSSDVTTDQSTTAA